MDNNDLKDIVLDSGEDDKLRASSIKKVLIFVVILVIIFLVVLIIMRFINQPETPENDSRLVLPPEPTQMQEKASNDEIFRQVPIIPEETKKESFEEMAKSLKEKEMASIKEEVKQEAQEAIEEPKELKMPEEPKVEPKPKPKVEPKQKPKPKPKPALKPKTEPSKAPSNASGTPKGTYIQVTATNKFDPSDKYLKNLKSKGYSYKLYKTSVNGKEYTKILVGPYDKNAINSHLSKIRKDINKDAFIFRVK